jgi:hypothetical protein
MCHRRRPLDIGGALCASLLIVADRFVARWHQSPVRRNLALIDDPSQRHFDAIIRYEDVPITALCAHLPAA